MRQVISSIINRCQTGFMPNRFIAENGLVLNIVMEHARRCNRNDIALLLDQEKAYDRVHPSYLRAVMLKFGFPLVLVNSIIGLFFGNRVRININGHFTNEINQYRGLHQGDPLSPLLFNLALEPLLRHIIQYNSFLGFSFAPLSSNISPPPALVELDIMSALKINKVAFYSTKEFTDSYHTVPESFNMSGNSNNFNSDVYNASINNSTLSDFSQYLMHERAKSVPVAKYDTNMSMRIWLANFEMQAKVQGITDLNLCGLHIAHYMPILIQQWLPTLAPSILASWELIKEALIARFGVSAEVDNQRLLKDLKRCKKGAQESIRLHATKWEHLLSLISEEYTEDTKINLFIQPLDKPETRLTV
ncbi:hypothetical protein G6F37_012845 [Rhizopus arrhizus]|nr:hypothetical protein G6F38_012481 [Rhizopus arrhizus]KAG1141257.1 hypothetical protein G6F37_012845 [Rhizopus arrhizus]